MTMRLLFAVLAGGLAVVAAAAWRGDQPIVAFGALAIAVWLGSQALRRQR